MGELMAAEVTELAGPKGKHDPARGAYRHGNEDGTVVLGGRKLPVQRPRVREVGGKELHLESYDTFSAVDLLTEHTVAAMLAGLSTRRYAASLEPVGAAVVEDACATSRSAVSRRFRAATASQVYRLVVERPERLSLKVLMALLDVLDCAMDELIEPVAAAGADKAAATGTGRGESGLGGLRPKRARIVAVDDS